VPLLRPQVRHRGDHAPRDARGCDGVGAHVDAVGDHADPGAAHPFALDLGRGRAGVRHDRVREPVGDALRRVLRVGAARQDQVAPAADADRDARDRRRRQREHVRVEVARVDHGEPPLPAPPREADERANGGRRQEPPQRELGDLGHDPFDLREPEALAAEAGDVHLEALAVEPADELGHLPLGPARVEAGDDDADRKGSARHAVS
jgi:hypothetical protein